MIYCWYCCDWFTHETYRREHNVGQCQELKKAKKLLWQRLSEIDV